MGSKSSPNAKCSCCAKHSLLSASVIGSRVMREARYANTHGAEGDYLGTGIIYYAIPYAIRALTCVCLGSGGGFVPRLMRQAQRDLGIEESKTILIDGDTGPWGRPCWTSPDSFFRSAWGDIEIMETLTSEGAEILKQRETIIDYLHIDADHSYEGVLTDLNAYYPMVRTGGFVSIHDADKEQETDDAVPGVRRAFAEWHTTHPDVTWLDTGFGPNGLLLCAKE